MRSNALISLNFKAPSIRLLRQSVRVVKPKSITDSFSDYYLALMPHDLSLLKDLIVVLLAAVPLAFVCSRLRLPTIVGFMLTGVLIGPFGLGLIHDVEAVEALAEIGVVLLLFTIGLEFSLRRIADMKRLVFMGGGLQVALSVLLATAVAWLFSVPVRQAIFYGFLFALSSTAIVLKTYFDRAEIDTPHGRAGVGILLFQDICVVPMMLLIPVLSGREASTPVEVMIRLGTALLAVVIIILTARFIMPRLLFHVVRLRSSEIFIIFIILTVLGTSWLTAQFGLSLALGAFIAGLVLSESEYSHQIVADILPFRDVFNSIFFVSIGMLLSITALIQNLPTVLILVVALFLGKALVLMIAMLTLKTSLRVSLLVALGLAQIGEFSFILARAGLPQGLLADNSYQIFLASSILLMVATPFLIQVAPHLGFLVESKLFPRAGHRSEADGLNPVAEELKGHVVIVGYGLNGRNLSKVLRRVGIPYLVLELNAETVRVAGTQGEPIVYGDSTRKEVLYHAGIKHARQLVLAISDPVATRRTVWLARKMNADLHIIVRTRYMSEMQDLYELGATEIIPEEFETSIEIFARVLREYGIARNVIQRQIEEIRDEGYQMLRAPSLPMVSMSSIADAPGNASTETLFIETGTRAAGRTLAELRLRKMTGATMITVVRDGHTEINPGPDFKLSANDIVVLLGSPENIEEAIEYISARETAGESPNGLGK